MEQSEAIELVRRSVLLILAVGAPVLLTALGAALIVSILQALTQVQEYTLSFVPKIFAVLLSVAIFGPWMIGRIVEFGREMFSTLP